MEGGGVGAEAKVLWVDPVSGVMREYMLREGMSATIGRSAANDIHIVEGHISRSHAVIRCRGGDLSIDDLGSVNGSYVNGERVRGSRGLVIGDEILLFVTMLKVVAAGSSSLEAEERVAEESGVRAALRIVKGPQKGQVYALMKDELTIGRAGPRAKWEIALQDATVSRPHAFMVREGGAWKLFDLGSVNGTSVNKRPVSGGRAHVLRDGDRMMFGAAMALFHVGGRGAGKRD